MTRSNAPTKKPTHASYSTCPMLHVVDIANSWLEPLTQMSLSLLSPKWPTLMLMKCGLHLVLENISGILQFMTSLLSWVLKKLRHSRCFMHLQDVTPTPSFLAEVNGPRGMLGMSSIVLHVLVALSSIPESIPEAYMQLLAAMAVNEARQQLFSKGSRTLENIPPTQTAMTEHTKRAAYQAGHVWGSALIAKPNLPCPHDWGWKREEGEWKPVWTVLPQAQESCYERIHCGCKKGCAAPCKCRKASLAFSALCNCGGHCQWDD